MSGLLGEQVPESNQTEILSKLENAVNTSDTARGKHYEVFRDSFDLQHCYSQQFILQRLKYIHDNLCAKKWMLADNPIDYPHSSANFYFDGRQGAYNIEAWLNWDAEN